MSNDEIEHMENLLEAEMRKAANYKAKLMMIKKLKDENKIKILRDESESDSERRSIRVDLNDIFMDTLSETQTINDLKKEIISLKGERKKRRTHEIENVSPLSNRTSQQSQIIVLNEAIKAIRREHQEVKSENASLRQEVIQNEHQRRESIESFKSSLSRECLQRDEEIESLNKRIERFKVKNERMSFEKAHKVKIIEMNVDKIETLNGMIKQMHMKRKEHLEQIDLLKTKLREKDVRTMSVDSKPDIEDALRAEIGQLQNENDEMKKRLVEHNVLLQKCDELEQYKRAFIGKLAQFEQDNEENLNKMKQQISRKDAQLEELCALNEANDEKLRFSQQVMQQMEKKVADHTALLLKCEELEHYKNASIKTLAKSERYREENFDKTKQEIQRQDLKLDEMAALNKANEEKIRFSKTVMQQMENECNQKNIKIASLQKNINDLRMEYEVVSSEKDDYMQHIGNLRKQLMAKEVQTGKFIDRDVLLCEMGTLKGMHEEEIQKFKQDAQQRECVLAQEIKEQIRQKQEAISKMKPNHEYVVEVERLNDEMRISNDKIENLEKEIEAIKRFKYDKKQIRAIINENNALKMNNKALMTEKEDLMRLMNAQQTSQQSLW